MANRIFTVIDEQPVYLPWEVSKKILLMLDGRSLHQARQVCRGWNEAVLNLLWGEDRVAVERKLENNWRFAQPRKIERSLKLDGFRGYLLTVSENRAVMMFTSEPVKQDESFEEEEGFDDEDDQEEGKQVKIIEFNTKEGKVVTSFDVTEMELPCLADFANISWDVENTLLMGWGDYEEYRVFACNLQTQQISFDEVFEDVFGEEDNEDGDKESFPVLNETTKELHIGTVKLKITEDNVTQESVENYVYVPNIVALKSNLCITESSSQGIKLGRRDGNNYEEISALHRG